MEKCVLISQRLLPTHLAAETTRGLEWGPPQQIQRPGRGGIKQRSDSRKHGETEGR